MTKESLTYRQLKDQLDEVLNKLQHEDTDIDEALILHKKGQELLKELEVYLGKAAKKADITLK